MSRAREALFDLAVNRAAEHAARLGAAGSDAAAVARALELWYLETRFAARVSLDEVARAVAARPGGAAHWQGGARGGWRPGPPPTP